MSSILYTALVHNRHSSLILFMSCMYIYVCMSILVSWLNTWEVPLPLRLMREVSETISVNLLNQWFKGAEQKSVNSFLQPFLPPLNATISVTFVLTTKCNACNGKPPPFWTSADEIHPDLSRSIADHLTFYRVKMFIAIIQNTHRKHTKLVT